MRRRALISVHDKEGVIPFARGLMEMGIELVATSGTFEYLRKDGIPVVEISKLIGMPSILSGRLKTIYYKIHGGILADRSRKEHDTQMQNLGLVPIDIVVVNLNPFSQEISFEDLIENIDTGGPALIRSAAKNYKHVLVVTYSEQYPEVLRRLKNKKDDMEFRANLAAIAFSATARYDALLASYMAAKLYTKELFPPILPGHYIRESYLKSGENHHQAAAFYRNLMSSSNTIDRMSTESKGKLSGSHLLDADIAWEYVSVFKKPTACIVKHCNPVGIAVNNTIKEAFEKSYSCDPVATREGFIALNQPMDLELTELIMEGNNAFSGIIATDYEDGVIEKLRAHPVWGSEIPIIKMPNASLGHSRRPTTLRAFAGGLLLEQTDEIEGKVNAWRIATRSKPNPKKLVDLAFALAIASLAKSSSAVLAKDNASIGIACGQSHTLEAFALATSKAGGKNKRSSTGI